MTAMIIQVISCLITAILLIIESVSDLKRREVDMKFLIAAFAAAVLMFIVSPQRNYIMFFGGMAEGLLLVAASFALREGIGIGDGLTLICTGALLGAKDNMLMFFGACVICSVFSAVLLIFKRAGRKTKIPFVPFLIPGFLFTCAVKL